MIRSAVFSDDRSKRYELIRDWRDEIGAIDKTAFFAMLNPSGAGEKDDDPTVRKVIGFCRSWGFGRCVIWNLIPDVSTDPWELPPWSGINPVNQTYLKHWIKGAEIDKVVVAWGGQPSALRRTIALTEHIYNFKQIAPVKLYCIDTTKRGDPTHPSRAPYTVAPKLWP